MRVLLDECVDWRLARHIAGHEVKTARTNRLADLMPRVPDILSAIASAKPGVATVVAGS